MELILIIIFFVYIYNMDKTIKNLQKENKELKRKLANLADLNKATVVEREINENNVQVKSVENVQKLAQSNPEIKKELTEEEKLERKLEKERQERETKNTTILITGAILIVLAAIVFLMSTWNTVSNIIKTVVLVLLIGVFLGASKIAKEKFKLEKASNTFFYLAMAYIPICLISCSIFGLFGKFLSIYGEGRYTYLAMSMLFTAGIYYLNYKRRSSNALLAGSVLSQIFSVILVGLIFSSEISLILILLLIYNIALIKLTKRDFGIELLKIFYNGIPVIAGLYGLGLLFDGAGELFLMIPLLTVNYFLLYTQKENSTMNAYLFNISLYAFGIFASLIFEYSFEILNSIRVIFGILYAISISVIVGVVSNKDNKLIKSSMVTSLVAVGIMGIRTLDNDTGFVKTYMVALIEAVLMFLAYLKSTEKGKSIFSYLIPITLIIAILDILHLAELNYISYIISSLVIFCIGELFVKEDYKLLNKGFFIISHINIVVTYWVCYILNSIDMANDVFLFILLELVYVYSFIKNRDIKLFKYISYSNIFFILLTSFEFLELPYKIAYLIPLAVSVIVIALENTVKDLNDQFSKIYISILNIISFIALSELENLASIVLGFAFAAYLIYENLKNKDIKYLRMIPMIGFMVIMQNAEIEEELQPIIVMLAAVAATFVSVYQKRFSIDTIFSMIYLSLALDFFDNSLIKEIFFIIWAFANMYFMKAESSKDIFKAITYVGIYALYKDLLWEFGLEELACTEVIGILILAIVLLKDIVKKYVKDLDTLEYFVFSIIYLYAIGLYTSESDGIVFVLFIVALVMYSYMKKYGAIFIISIIAILANAILLTREFWLSIPWWIYLLLVGGILIGFAIKNESDDKKEKISVGNVIKNLKDKIEK